MSQFYYQQQRNEDIASLQCMFGPPWTVDLLGGVLDYYNGNVDEAISRLLILNEHHNGNPQPLVERLLLSGTNNNNARSHSFPLPALAATAKRGGRSKNAAGNTKNSTASIPKSMLKKAPPPRRSTVAVTMADTFEPAVITIDKQTRRRVGIHMKLPDDFLRIPKTPLFATNSLDLLRDMPPPFPTPDDNESPSWRTNGSSSKTTPLQQGAPTKFQALRASMNFPTFQNKKPGNDNTLQNNHTHQPTPVHNKNTAPVTTMLSKFSVPKMTVPTLHLPTLAAKKNNEEDTTSNTETTTTKGGGWSLSNMSLKTPTSLTGIHSQLRARNNSTDHPAQEQAVLSGQKTGKWSLSAIGSSVRMSPKGQNTDSNQQQQQEHNQYENSTQDAYGAIPKVQHRGITVRELKQLVQDVKHLCVKEQWKSTESGRVLRPEQVTMYDLVKHFILPRTHAHACSYIEATFGESRNVRDNEHANGSIQKGQHAQWFVSHAWTDSVFHVTSCVEQHALDHDFDSDTAMYWVCALAMNQYSSSGASIAIETIDESSLKNPLMMLDVMNASEGVLAVIDKNSIYFRRSWCLWEFFLAIERSRASYRGDGHHYFIDVYTTNDDSKVVGLTDGFVAIDKYKPSKQDAKQKENSPTHAHISKEAVVFQRQPCNQLEWSEFRTQRQAQFQHQTCVEALNVNLESSHASMEEDTRRIMNSIVQYSTNGNDIFSARAHEAEALTTHPGYSRVNAMVQGTFAAKAYRHALEETTGSRDLAQERLQKIQAILSNSPIENLEVSFAGCSAFQIREALKFSESLPTSLRSLDLDYSYLEFQYAEEFATGFGRLDKLESFKINCAYCAKLENLDRLWEELGKLVSLRRLVIVAQPNKKLTSVDGLAAALSNMPNLENLELEFDCYGDYSKLVAMAKGEASLNNMSSTYLRMTGKVSNSRDIQRQFDRLSKLTDLDLGGGYISDSSIQKLMKVLVKKFDKTALTLKLRFLGSLGKKLKPVENIEDLQQALQRIRNGLKLFS